MQTTRFTDCGTPYAVTTTDQGHTTVTRKDQIIYDGPGRTLLGNPGEYYAITTSPHLDEDTVVRERIAETVNFHLVGPEKASELRDAAHFRTSERIKALLDPRAHPGAIATTIRLNILGTIKAGEDADPIAVY